MRTSTRNALPVSRSIAVALIAFSLIWSACDDGALTSPPADDPAGTPVTLSFTAPSGAAATGTSKADASRTHTDDQNNALTIATVEVVLREITFKRADADAACRTDDDDDCEEVEDGPLLVNLPLGSERPAVVVESTLPVGLWEEVEFDVDALDDDDDAAFLDETGFPEDVSIRVTGTWTPAGGSAQAFTYLSDLSEEKDIEFEPPIEVTADAPKNVTFAIDVDRWFRQSDGTLVNPAAGNDDGRYEDLIEENIENSIEGFEDDDRNGDGDHGSDDGREDDEDDGSEDRSDDSDDDGNGEDDGSDDDGDDGSDDDGDDQSDDGDDGDDRSDDSDDGYDDDEGEDDATAFEAELSGDHEVPAVETDAEGEVEFHYDREDHELAYEIELEDIEAITQAHIHLGGSDENGPVVATLLRFTENVDGSGEGTPFTPEDDDYEAEGTITADDVVARDGFDGSLDALIQAMRAGNAYVNVHTVANPSGEIRGQIEADDDGDDDDDEDDDDDD